MSKRVLLTGAGGFVGSHVLRHLLERTDWHIVVTDSFRRRGSLDRIAEQVHDRPHRERLTTAPADLAHPLTAQTIYKFGEPDYIVNVASDSHVDGSIVDPRGCIENNVSLVLTLLDYAVAYGCEKFIQVSTDEVYGPAPVGHAHREGEPHRPSNPYSASKACQEDICFSYWRTYGVPVIVTNTMNLFGEMQHVEKFVPMTLAKILAGETVQIHAAADGTIGSRMWLHARNQADALLFILEHVPGWGYREGLGYNLPRFNVVGQAELTNLGMADMIATAVGKDAFGWNYELVDFHGSRPGHDLRYALDGTRLAGYGWKPPVLFEESLRRTVEWTMAHPEWLLDAAVPAAA